MSFCCAFTFAIASDTCLGRVDTALLDDQTLMEILFECTSGEGKNRLLDHTGTFKSFKCIDDVEFEEDGHLFAVDFSGYNLQGTLQLDFMPQSMLYFFVKGNKLHGTLDTSKLPRTLLELDISKNFFFGTIEWGDFPECARSISLSSNQFTGSVDLCVLPNVYNLSIDRNAFMGRICLSSLPEALVVLKLSNNRLGGEVSFASLPESLALLDISYNQLSGRFLISNPPHSLETLCADGNLFEGTAVVASVLGVGVTLECDGIQAVKNENGKAHKHEMDILGLVYWQRTAFD